MQLNTGVARKQKYGEITNMETSQEGIALIKLYEGCRLESYQCSAGVWTIGYGSTKNVKDFSINSGKMRLGPQNDHQHKIWNNIRAKEQAFKVNNIKLSACFAFLLNKGSYFRVEHKFKNEL